MDLANKVALISGGARMGQAVALALSRQGCDIILTWRRSRDSAAQSVDAVVKSGGRATELQSDLADPTDLERLGQTIEKTSKRLHIIVNLASVYEATPAEPTGSLNSWDEHMNANARSAYLLSRSLAPLLKRSGGGRIIHISDWTSASGRPRYKDYSAYYVSKAALKSVVEAMALELAPDVLVNAIAPGPMIPPPGMSTDEIQAVEKATPVGRWGGAEAMAQTVLFLAQTDFITGETIRLDGGRHLL